MFIKFKKSSNSLEWLEQHKETSGLYIVKAVDSYNDCSLPEFTRILLTDGIHEQVFFLSNDKFAINQPKINTLIAITAIKRFLDNKSVWQLLWFRTVELRVAVEYLFESPCANLTVTPFYEISELLDDLQYSFLSDVIDVCKNISGINSLISGPTKPLHLIQLELMMNWLYFVDLVENLNGEIIVLGWIYWIRSQVIFSNSDHYICKQLIEVIEGLSEVAEDFCNDAFDILTTQDFEYLLSILQPSIRIVTIRLIKAHTRAMVSQSVFQPWS